MNAMIKWRNLPGEHTELFSQIGLRLLDEISGVAPYGKIRISLDIKDENGEWQKTGIKPLITLSGVITYPGLERRAEVAGQPIRHFRIRLDADFHLAVTSPEGTNYEIVEMKKYPWQTDRLYPEPPAIVACNNDILQDILGHSIAENTGKDNFETVRLVWAAYQSAATGQRILISEF